MLLRLSVAKNEGPYLEREIKRGECKQLYAPPYYINNNNKSNKTHADINKWYKITAIKIGIVVNTVHKQKCT